MEKTTPKAATAMVGPRPTESGGTRRVEVDISLRASTYPRASIPITPSRSRPSLWLISRSSDVGTRRFEGKVRQARSETALPSPWGSPTTSSSLNGCWSPSRPAFGGSPALVEKLRPVRWAPSDAQLSTFGVYELTTSRHKLLCGLQGASGVADSALLGTFLHAPAAYSSEGRQAFRRKQQQAFRSAAQVAGRRQGRPVTSSAPSSTPATGRVEGGGEEATQRAAGRQGRSRKRRCGQGEGGSTAAGAGTK
jgi:hypothetical protein